MATLTAACADGPPKPTSLGEVQASPNAAAASGAQPTTSPTTSPTAPQASSPTARFPAGITYARPASSGPSLLAVAGGAPLARVEAPGPGFAIRRDLAVTTRVDALIVTTPDGKQRVVQPQGLRQVVRPSLSPDGKRVAVQGADANDRANPPDLNIYIVDLASGSAKRIGNLPWNEESPEWVPGTEYVVYSSFSAADGVNLHIFDVAAERELLTVHDAGAIHLAISADGRRLLDPGRALIYEIANPAQPIDLRVRLREGIRAAGYELDTRFPGQANRGTFPLDGDFSPDGRSLVFDGAVKQGDRYGVVLFTVDIDGGNLKVLSDLISVDPARSNNHNFSQLTPTWLAP